MQGLYQAVNSEELLNTLMRKKNSILFVFSINPFQEFLSGNVIKILGDIQSNITMDKG